jgi:DNA polymerase III epsilon subunit-like protein
MNKIICVDTETGGVNPFNSALCSVTLKVVGEDKIKTIYIEPTENREYAPIAFKINGLSKDYLQEHGVSELEAINQIKQFVKNEGGFKPIVLAHNIIFDVQFMNALFARHNQGLFMDMMHYHPMDTMILMKALKNNKIIQIDSISLSSCYKYFFGDMFKGAHTSEGDVIATEELYLKINELMNKSL